ncbi:MAG TPA: hypothetical protein VL308_16115 [Gemmatimonadaceae bacterium]|nr:hypothetical protein [Gemmatimonadaceae bacterium]
MFVSALALMALVPLACDSPRIDSPTPAAPTFARTTSGPTVTGANPPSGHQGDVTLDVTIAGSGFDSGSRASWQRNGVDDPKIRVNSTRFNSSTSLTANITIAVDAVATTYDIAVTTSTGKKGIGAELFTVTYAVAIGGVANGVAISDGGVVVGAGGPSGTSVVAWSPSSGLAVVATKSVVWDIDRAGQTIGGQDAAGKPVIWTSATGLPGSWVAMTMLDLGGGGAVRGIASDAAGNAVLMTGNVFGNGRNAVVWTRTASGWVQRINARLTGAEGAWGQAINRRGQVVGKDGTTCCTAVYWDSLGAPTRLPVLPGKSGAAAWSINGDGTIVVGNSDGTPVLWRRTLVGGVYGPWTVNALESFGDTCRGGSIAYDVNSAGTIAVGSSCQVAVAWTIAAGSATLVALQGLGPPNVASAIGINDAVSPRAAGTAKSTQGVYWWGF